MKPILLCALLLCFGMTIARANQPALKHVQASPAHKGIKGYFTRYLSGDKTPYTSDKRIKHNEIKYYQQLVWEAWREANLSFDEQSLPKPSKLSNGDSAHWNLPEELEPKAIMPYYWGTKGDVKPEDGYPLYLYLHGSGPKEQEWHTGLLLCQRFDDAPSLYFIPQIPNTGNYYRWWQRAKLYAWEKLLRQAFVSGEINANRVYVFGISEGGYGSQRLAAFYADYWAAAGPMAGGEPLKNAPAENCGNMGFSLLTGADDAGFHRNRLTAYVRAAFDSLQALYPDQYKHHIELIPQHGHAINYQSMTPWFKQFTRNPYPKHFCWENFEMDGCYRDAFYNLYIQERSNDTEQTRTYYEITIRDNHIDLQVNEVSYQCIEKDPKQGIELKFSRTLQPARKGKILIYLCNELVDINKKITVTANGRNVFKGKVKPNIKHMVNSCSTFFDPTRIYPAAIEVDLTE